MGRHKQSCQALAAGRPAQPGEEMPAELGSCVCTEGQKLSKEGD